VAGNGGTATATDISTPCSSTLASQEPDKATVNCSCTAGTTTVQVNAFDQAKFACLTPGLSVVKQCTPTVAACGQTATSSFMVTADEDAVSDLCASWNAHDGLPAESITVRYKAKNTGTATLNGCAISESNAGITGGPVQIGTVAGNGGTATATDITTPCSDTL